MITRLRALREKYKISLAELERTADVCDQELSRLELGIRCRSQRREKRVGDALAALIAVRRAQVDALEQDYLNARGHLLEMVEGSPDEP